MSEPFLERLSRFTPDAGRLDRDALLFAAGRGSVRPNRGWITLATLLAGTQALSLVLLWPHPTPSAGRLTVAVATAPLEARTSEALTRPGVWSARQRLQESKTDNVPDDTITLIDSGPPLKVFGPLPPSLLN
jgi:hypothetical protein